MALKKSMIKKLERYNKYYLCVLIDSRDSVSEDEFDVISNDDYIVKIIDNKTKNEFIKNKTTCIIYEVLFEYANYIDLINKVENINLDKDTNKVKIIYQQR